jgi:hypothetical protein
MGKYLVVIFLIIITMTTIKEPVDCIKIEHIVAFEGIKGENVRSAIQTSEEEYVLAGYVSSYGAGSWDLYLAKTNSNGEIEWNHTYGGPGLEGVDSLVGTSDGGFAMVGSTTSYGEGGDDIWLVKTDENGIVEWNHTYGGSKFDSPYSIIQTTDSSFVIAGATGFYSAKEGDQRDVFLVKTDDSGEYEWNRTYSNSDMEKAHCVIQTLDDGYALTGVSDDRRPDEVGDPHCWLIKTNNEGEIEWRRDYDSLGTRGADSIILTSDNGYILSGITDKTHDFFHDSFLIKTNSNGEVEWKKTFGGKRYDTINSIIQTTDGGFVFTGMTSSYGANDQDLWAVKINNVGEVEWELKYGGSKSDRGISIFQTSQERFTIIGRTGCYKEGNCAFWLVKLIQSDNVSITARSSSAWNISIALFSLLILNIKSRRYLHKKRGKKKVNLL